MSKVSHNPAVKTAVLQGGQANVNRMGAGGGAKKAEKQQQAVAAPSTQTSNTTSEGGVKTTTKPDGSVSKQAESGLQMESSTDGSRTISFGDSDEKLKIADGKVEVTGGGAKSAEFTKTEDGLELISFLDKKGNQVQVDPDSMTYEVLNKKQTVAQVFHPDGHQEVVAFGTHRSADGTHTEYQKRALYDKQGALVNQEGFDNLQAKDGKISFSLGDGVATRTLARPLPGQPEVTESPKAESAAGAKDNSAATAPLLAEQPLLLTGPEKPLLLEYKPESGKSTSSEPVQQQLPMDLPEVKAPENKVAPEAPKAEPKAENAPQQLELPLDPKQRLARLKEISADFFNPEKAGPDVSIQETPSGLVTRSDAETIAYSLPTGDKFRTDGEQVAVLGENPRAKNARLVQEDDGRILLSYNDKNRNSYQMNMQTGELEISNADGTMRQFVRADGSQAFEARSVHTTEAGSVRPSFHRAEFDAEGNLVRKQGFEDLKVGDKHLEYKLPNGNPTVRNLFTKTGVKFDEGEAKAAQAKQQAAKDEWNIDALVESVIGKVPGKSGPETSNQVDGGAKMDAPLAASPFEKPQFAPSGMSRTTLPDGSTMTRLPNGITITDGEKISAKDADGNPLQVIKREVPSQGTYVLYAKSKEGHGYTIAPDHLDMITESKDGKVHQLVTEQGQILTNIQDGKNQHLHNFEMSNMMETASPGVRSDIRTPNRLFIDGPEGRSYELPHALPSPQNSMTQRPYGQLPPGHPQPGYKPSFWDKAKAFFKGEPMPDGGPQQMGPGPQGAYAPGPQGYYNQQYHHQQPPQFGQMPGSHYHYDHGAQEIRQMERMGKVMSTVSWVGLGLTALSTFTMPGLFFPFGGMYY